MASAKTFNAVAVRKNETDYPDFVNICLKSQMELKEYLYKVLMDFYPETTETGDGYLYAKGTIPVLLTAHMDTVHKDLIQDFFEHKTKEGRTIINSPQGIGGDDRCGIYMILQILRTTEMRPSILFCEDEEIGGVGSDKFCSTEFVYDLSEMKFLIELDRANAFDAVFYEDDNADFHEWITKETGYREEWGSFSDICNLSPVCGIASVNLSCGYYNAHTTDEFVVVEEMLHTIETVKHLLTKTNEVEAFEYVETIYQSPRYNYGYGYYGGWALDNYGTTTTRKTGIIEVYFIDPETNEKLVWSKEVKSEDEGWKEFFFDQSHVCMDNVYDYDFYSI